MPALAERLGADWSGYQPVDKGATPTGSNPPTTDKAPGLNVFLRCPIPPVWNTSSDSLRQFYHNHEVPQVRLFNPPSENGRGGGTTINNYNTTGTASSGGSSSSVTTLAITQTSYNSPSLGPNASYSGSFTMSKAFQLMTLSASTPCRVRLYGNATAQSNDAYRGIDVAPPAGTMQGIICDVMLDTSPLIWQFQDRIGSNSDTPNTSTVYITVTNTDVITESVRVTFQYVPIVS
jgi:hypothetical protein